MTTPETPESERASTVVLERQGRDPKSLTYGFAEHLKYSLAKDRYTATAHDRYLAFAFAIRDRLVERWIETQQTHHVDKVKRVYYLSLEFLIGRLMTNNVINLGLKDAAGEALSELGLSWEELCEEERDAGLGNGGLGRLAACFLDSLATLQIPAFGYGLRYQYGIFRQTIENGHQTEHPDDWLRGGNPWEIARPEYRIAVHFGGHAELWKENAHIHGRWVDTQPVIGIPYDTAVVGYGGNTVNTLRLWNAVAAEDFDFEDFNRGDYVAAVESKVLAENLTKVLYPNDLHYMGKELRLKQQYFFVACSLYDIVRRFKADEDGWEAFPDRAAIQLNDTHPSMAVPELLRLLLDREGLAWDEAWDIAVRTFGYTNHTLMPEALEKWPVPMLERLLPRHLQIIYEINHRFLQKVTIRFPGESERLARMSLVQEGEPKQIRMANMAMVGSHSTNGVAAIHTDLLKSRVVPDFADMFPERFNAKTNGVTPRRWLLGANPPLAALITDRIGAGWVRDLDELEKLKPLAEDPDFQQAFREVKRSAKAAFADYAKQQWDIQLDTEAIFDVQIKRLHEYKRQLLNAIHIVILYNRLRKQPDREWTPQVFLFGAKAAPGYEMAKRIIKLISNLGNVINRDPVIASKLRVHFLPNYRVSLAERIIPAADVSEQISTAGTEASGTGNMKFMLNGALTIGTLDGANIEIMEEVGAENMFIFGLNAEQVEATRPEYDPQTACNQQTEVKEALDLIFSGHFNVSEPGIFEPIRKALFEWGDRYLHFADLPSYIEAQEQIQATYRQPEIWTQKAILNVASAGKFSSDRTIRDYAREIWSVEPHPIDLERKRSHTIVEVRAHHEGKAAPSE